MIESDKLISSSNHLLQGLALLMFFLGELVQDKRLALLATYGDCDTASFLLSEM
jgi:hypothetical protein